MTTGVNARPEKITRLYNTTHDYHPFKINVKAITSALMCLVKNNNFLQLKQLK